MMKRKRARNRNELDAPMVDRITVIKGDHPLWGYRRICQINLSRMRFEGLRFNRLILLAE